MIRLLICFLLTIPAYAVFAQDIKSSDDKEAAYARTILSRSEKIVSTLGISDSLKAKKITIIIAAQYRSLNDLYNTRDEVKLLKQGGGDKDAIAKQLTAVEEATTKQAQDLNKLFLSKLSADLSPGQVIEVKDGMTYNVLPITYKAFLEMIPSLSTGQKDQIMKWLVEAREYAMAAESSEKKHWWFGKYKGRINNCLAAEGYDLQKEREGWEKRKADKSAKTVQ